MATVAEGLQSQIRNIEKKYGKSMSEWTEIVRASGKTKHNDLIALLKEEYGMSHGSANRVALIAREAEAASIASAAESAGADPVLALYDGPKAALRPIHDRLMAVLAELGGDIELAPKKGYVSVRRRKQFAIVQPSTKTRVDVGLVLKATPTSGRLEPGAGFNAMCSHRVRLESAADVDAELIAWLRQAYEQANLRPSPHTV